MADHHDCMGFLRKKELQFSAMQAERPGREYPALQRCLDASREAAQAMRRMWDAEQSYLAQYKE